jgi:hypothetical protein
VAHCSPARRQCDSGLLFGWDCFGALQAVPENAAGLTAEELHEGPVFWASVDFLRMHMVVVDVSAKELDVIRAMEPKLILSSHLANHPGTMTKRVLSSLAATPSAQRFVGPEQAALEQLLAQVSAVTSSSSQQFDSMLGRLPRRHDLTGIDEGP